MRIADEKKSLILEKKNSSLEDRGGKKKQISVEICSVETQNKINRFDQNLLFFLFRIFENIDIIEKSIK